MTHRPLREPSVTSVPNYQTIYSGGIRDMVFEGCDPDL